MITPSSRNDQHWKQLKDVNEVARDGDLTSEAALYPIEYLFVGGVDGANLEDKLSSITDGSSLLLYFWKVHNAVSSSVNRGLTCKTEEQADDPSYACSPDGSIIFYSDEVASTRLLGRVWPTATRFQFWLSETDTYADIRGDMEDAHVELNKLDREYGRTLRDLYWTDLQDKELYIDAAQDVMDAIASLDEAILKSGLLFTEYINKANEPGSCESFEKSLSAFEPLDVPLPLVEGN